MNALSPSMLLDSTSLSSPGDADAELIRVCGAHRDKIDAVNNGDGLDDDPDCLAYGQSRDFISNTKATTLAGLLAKARAAKAEAVTFYGEGEEEHWQNCPAENWAADVCNELPGLFGSAPLSSDTELIGACHEYLRIQRELEAYYVTLDGDMEGDDPHWAILNPVPGLRDKIATLRATTAEGFYARARCVAFHYLPEYKGCLDQPDGAAEDRFTGANLRDMVRAERGAPDNYAVAPYVSLDAELLKVCAAFDEMECASLATFQGQEPGSAEETAAETERERLSEAQEPLVERMCELEAITREGMAARARSLALWDAELMKPDRCFISDRLTAAIVRDLLAGSAAA